MTPETEALIARVRELDATATKGPWDILDYGRIRDVEGKTICEYPRVDNSAATWRNNKALIMHYRTAAPKLADALEAAEKRADAAEAKLKVARDILAVAYKAGKIAQIPSAHYLLEAMESALTQLEP